MTVASRVFVLLAALVLLGTAGNGGEKTALVVGVSKTPSALPVLRMMESGALGDGVEIDLVVWTGPEQLIAMTQDGRHHLFSLPVTVAARLHNRGVGIVLTNVNTWGGIRLVSTDPNVGDWRDLAGKTLYLPQRSSPPDVLTRLFLERAGLSAGKDVELVYAPVAEITQLLKTGRIEHAVLIEPRVTAALMGTKGLRVVRDYAEEWKGVAGAEARLPSLGFGGTRAFVESRPELARRFEQAYAEAADWVLEHPAEAAALAERRLGLDPAVTERAVPTLGLEYVPAAGAAADLECLYKTLIEHSPAMIGDGVPDATFYWRE